MLPSQRLSHGSRMINPTIIWIIELEPHRDMHESSSRHRGGVTFCEHCDCHSLPTNVFKL
jgi:hypothetical protein